MKACRFFTVAVYGSSWFMVMEFSLTFSLIFDGHFKWALSLCVLILLSVNLNIVPFLLKKIMHFLTKILVLIGFSLELNPSLCTVFLNLELWFCFLFLSHSLVSNGHFIFCLILWTLSVLQWCSFLLIWILCCLLTRRKNALLVHDSDPPFSVLLRFCCFRVPSLELNPTLYVVFLKLERIRLYLVSSLDLGSKLCLFVSHLCDVLLEFQDSLIVKHPKKNPLVLRMLVLMFVMVCGVYICAVCLKQIDGHTAVRILSIPVAAKPCDSVDVEPSEKPYVHFPKPATFSRFSFRATLSLIIIIELLLNLMIIVWFK